MADPTEQEKVAAVSTIEAVLVIVVTFFMVMLFGGFMLPSLMPWNLALPIIIGCYFVFTLFALITLPVEFDASKRALAWVEERNIVTSGEHGMAKDALNWAAMTYVVAALGSLIMLLYYVMMFMGGGDD